MSPLPLIVVQTELVEERNARLADPYTKQWMERRAYLWLFGPKLRLPFGAVTEFRTVDTWLTLERPPDADLSGTAGTDLP
jgi:hypothetical protein